MIHFWHADKCLRSSSSAPCNALQHLTQQQTESIMLLNSCSDALQEASVSATNGGASSPAAARQEPVYKFQPRQAGGRPSDGFVEIPLHSPNSSAIEAGQANGAIAKSAGARTQAKALQGTTCSILLPIVSGLERGSLAMCLFAVSPSILKVNAAKFGYLTAQEFCMGEPGPIYKTPCCCGSPHLYH